MTGTLGDWCFRHRRTVFLGWLLVVVAGVVAGSQVFGRLDTGRGGASSMESLQGYAVLDAAAEYGDQVVVLVDGAEVAAPATRAAVTAAADAARAVPGVGRVVTTYDAPQAGLAATDGLAQLVTVDLDKGLAKGARDAALAAVEETFDALETALPGSTVRFGGSLLVFREVNEQVERDTRKGELLSLPVVLVVLVLIFGGLLAASLPLAGAIGAVTGTFAALFAFTFLMELNANVVSVGTVLALGLGIDYALLLVSRFREERGHGLDVQAAAHRMSATAGRTILFSGLTVATSLAALFLFESVIYRAIAAAGVTVVVLSMLAALTLVPALLGVFGHRITAPTEPVSEDGVFARLARRVQRHPWAVVVSLLTVFLVVGFPFLRVQLGEAGAKLLPRSFESRQVADAIDTRFGDRGLDPVVVVARTDPAALTAYAGEIAGRDDVGSVGPVTELADGYVSVDVRPTSAEGAQDLVRDLRADDPGFETWVTGADALLVDFTDEIATRGPWALAFIVVATYVLLFLMTGSILVPVKALVMNVLSLSATFGVLVLVFQEGWLSGPLGFDATGSLETWMPVIVFAFAFGLSMDYEVFLLSRIKEAYDSGLSNDRAVEVGLQRSGRIITSAALVVVLVFAGFATGQMLGIKQMGVALALAVAVDATLVRMLLVPATMTLLGDLNWWAPGWARRLHDRFGLREEPADDPTPSTVPAGHA